MYLSLPNWWNSKRCGTWQLNGCFSQVKGRSETTYPSHCHFLDEGLATYLILHTAGQPASRKLLSSLKQDKNTLDYFDKIFKLVAVDCFCESVEHPYHAGSKWFPGLHFVQSKNLICSQGMWWRWPLKTCTMYVWDKPLLREKQRWSPGWGWTLCVHLVCYLALQMLEARKHSWTIIYSLPQNNSLRAKQGKELLQGAQWLSW